MKLKRIVVVDDSQAIRALVTKLLLSNAEGAYSVVGEGATAGHAIELTQLLRPDALILDVEMPGQSGLDILPSLGCPVVILSTERKAGGAQNKFLHRAVFLDKLDIAKMDIAAAIERAIGLYDRYRTQALRRNPG
jgi:chemotaxis response regulator CheB